MSGKDQHGYRFSRFTLSLATGTLLTEAGEELALRPKSFAMLRYFVENAERLIDRDELIRAVWPGVFVSDDSIAQCIADIRRALGSEGPRLLRTVQRRGYRFAGPISVMPSSGPAEDSHAEPVRPAPAPTLDAANWAPMIAVLPFQNISGDPEQEYFADGMVEEIITALSRIRWLLVAARNSTFIYKHRAVDIKQVGRELGVRYVLEGSVRRSAQTVRITAQLIDARNGTHLWADRFDGSLQDVFDLQDKIALAVAGVIEPTLLAAEARRTVERPTRDLTAYDLYLRAYAVALPSGVRFREALALTEQAIARDPNFGLALSFAAICYLRLVFDGLSKDPHAEGSRSVELARRSLLAARDDPTVMAQAAIVLMYFGEDAATMLSLVDRALALSPSYARGWYLSGTMRIWAGETEQGIEHVERALRLSAGTRFGWAAFMLGMAYFLTRRFEAAVPKLLLGINDDPTFPEPYRFLAAAYAHMGRLDEAGKIITRLREITPLVIPTADHLRVPEQRELFLSGLRIAMGGTE